MTFQIVALIIIAILVLFPALYALRRLRQTRASARTDAATDRFLREAPRQLTSEIILLLLILAALAVAVLMRIGPF